MKGIQRLGQQLVLLVAFGIVSGSALASISEYQLKNGMRVVVKEDHRAPVVVHQVWYKVGSNYEPNGVTGISHMLEHMMFKGTKTLRPGEFSKRVAQLGGEENAFTSTDYTAYYQAVGKQHLEEVMRLEADRMRHIVITDDEFKKERDVVTEERRWRVEDKPAGKLYEQFKAAAFVSSPARQPTIGWMQDIRHYTAEDARQWYRQWYAPNNATLVVVGDVDPQSVYQLAKKYYGAYEPEEIVAPKPQREFKQEGERRITLRGATKLPQLLIGFHAPTLVTAQSDAEKAEVYALSVLSDILSGDDSARFSKNLIRGSKVVASAGSNFDATDRLQTLFILNATPNEGKTPQEAEQELWAEIKKLQQQPISQDELDRVLAQSEAQYIYHQDSIQSQAIILGSLLSVGLPPDTLDNWVENLRRVTPQMIQAVARKYFSPEQQTVAVLVPNGEEATGPVTGALPGKGVH
ncbi:pitrilysin family protein [Thiomicrorhabdus sp. 6S3-12]|uniref:M16 family metallopeptidase n=1 Tax=Thiomicrorhabdus sp. 6S3-12 TaxID=2819681 RepID=UPI001AAC74A5|nr:pitrilysin family protein [Thiomicrorhabdus sp. 6S3-12]MBO1925044.1 insulinase family protein [Thiomicrorhabdus sp. 6S3-12]